MRRAARVPVLAALLAATTALGCAAGVAGLRSREPLRISDVRAEDPVRRASLRLVDQGLEADVAARPNLALSQYERAIQIDPTNPYAYLAISRHHLEAGEPRRALEYLEQAGILMESEEAMSPRVEAHLLGMRGAALEAQGRSREGSVLLAEARDLAPSVWGDGRLSARELR